MALKKTGRQIPDQTTETRTVEEQSAPILQLPNDILTLVLEKAVLKDDGPISSSEESIEIYDNQSTLRVTRTCRAFYSCAIAFLYQSIHLDCSNDKGVRKVTRLGEALERTPVLAWSCSELSVRVPEYDWGFPPRQLSRVVGRLGHVRTLRVHGCLFLLNPAHSPSSWTLLRLAPMFMPKLEHLHLSGNMSIQVHPLIEELDFPSLRTVRLGHISTSKRGRKGELRLNPERKPSSVTELSLFNYSGSVRDLQTLINWPPYLTKFYLADGDFHRWTNRFRAGWVPPTLEMDASEVLKMLSKHKDTLQVLELHDSQRTTIINPMIDTSEFTALEELTLCWGQLGFGITEFRDADAAIVFGPKLKKFVINVRGSQTRMSRGGLYGEDDYGYFASLAEEWVRCLVQAALARNLALEEVHILRMKNLDEEKEDAWNWMDVMNDEFRPKGISITYDKPN